MRNQTKFGSKFGPPTRSNLLHLQWDSLHFRCLWNVFLNHGFPSTGEGKALDCITLISCAFTHIPYPLGQSKNTLFPWSSPSNLPTSIFNSLHNFHQSQTGSHHEMALSPLCISNGVPLLQHPGPFFDLHYCTPFLNFHLLWNVASPAVAKRQKMLENLSGPGSIHWWCGSGLLM